MNKREIHQYTIQGVYIRSFNSITGAADYFEKDESVIRKVTDKYPNRSACGYFWSSEKYTELPLSESTDEKEPEITLPKILIFDIETAPLRAYVWARFKQNVYTDQMMTDWFMLTWAAKWLFGNETYSDKITSKEVKDEDDSRIVHSMYDLINEADIVIAHNAERFDVAKINSRFVVNDLPPTSPYQVIDTLKIAKKQFGFSSNKLDELAIVLNLGIRKLDTDFTLWSGCMDGDKQSINEMEEYNRYDVTVLEEVYLKIRPWIKSHPNLALYSETDSSQCSNCGSTKLKYIDNYYYTPTGKYEIMQCRECGAMNRKRHTSVHKDKRKNLLVSVSK